MFEKVFINRDGVEFSASHDAERWCEARGISVGHMERDRPRGLLFGDFEISKWRNMTTAEQRELHGHMVAGAGSFRGGPITVRLFTVSAEPAVVAREED